MDDNFEAELKTGFLDEAKQLLADSEQCFLSLEQNAQDVTILEKIFRLAHNLKGSSRAVGFESLGAFTHEFESFLLKCKSGSIGIGPETVTLLLKCNDHLNHYIEALRADFNAQVGSDDLILELKSFQAQVKLTSSVEAASPQPAVSDLAVAPAAAADITSTISESERLKSALELLRQGKIQDAAQTVEVAEEPSLEECLLVEIPSVVEPKLTAPVIQKNNETSPPVNAAAGADDTIRVSIARLERLLNFVGEMVILQTVLREQSYGDNAQLLRRTVHQIGKVTKEVQDLSMSLRMVPLKQTFQKMQRIVRDTSNVLGKKVNLIWSGEEAEVDKTVLEALSDPLVHLIRNAVDHGIESPSDRLSKNKSESGTVKLLAYHQSGKLVIEVSDDGGGIPADRLRQKAIERGILRADQQLTDKEAVALIFHPGFSTKSEVTEVSGRGVGMDVVKTNIEKLQGEIIVDTELGKGSTFKVILPLTLAIIDGMVVRCGEERFVIPLSHVHESMRPQPGDLQFTTGIGEVLLLRGENLPVIRLSEALGRRTKNTEGTNCIAIIVRTQGRSFAALVDDIIGQYQVVIKKLGAEISQIKGCSGSAILGDGRPALILELSELAASPSKKGMVA